MKLRGYVFSRPFMNERVPQNIQNLVLRDFCNKNNFKYFLSATEYAMKDSHMILEKTINEIGNLDGIVMYSLRQLPEKKSYRYNLIEALIAKKKVIHFALENKYIDNLSNIELIDEIINIISIQNIQNNFIEKIANWHE